MQEQYFNLATFLGSEQIPFVQPRCIYTSSPRAKCAPWKAGRAHSWCMHARYTPLAEKNPKDSPCCFTGVAASAGWSYIQSISDVSGRLTYILLVVARASHFLKTCAYMSNRGLMVWLRAFVTGLGKPTRRRVFALVLLCQRAGCLCLCKIAFHTRKKIKRCTFARYGTLHLKGSQSDSLTEWTHRGIRSRAKPSIQQLESPVAGRWLVWTGSCAGWMASKPPRHRQCWGVPVPRDISVPRTGRTGLLRLPQAPTPRSGCSPDAVLRLQHWSKRGKSGARISMKSTENSIRAFRKALLLPIHHHFLMHVWAFFGV